MPPLRKGPNARELGCLRGASAFTHIPPVGLAGRRVLWKAGAEGEGEGAKAIIGVRLREAAGARQVGPPSGLRILESTVPVQNPVRVPQRVASAGQGARCLELGHDK